MHRKRSLIQCDMIGPLPKQVQLNGYVAKLLIFCVLKFSLDFIEKKISLGRLL